jgi:hypothetical protein
MTKRITRVISDMPHQVIARPVSQAARDLFEKFPVDRAMVDEYLKKYGVLNGCSISFAILIAVNAIIKALNAGCKKEDGLRLLEASEHFIAKAFDYTKIDDFEFKNFLNYYRELERRSSPRVWIEEQMRPENIMVLFHRINLAKIALNCLTIGRLISPKKS